MVKLRIEHILNYVPNYTNCVHNYTKLFTEICYLTHWICPFGRCFSRQHTIRITVLLATTALRKKNKPSNKQIIIIKKRRRRRRRRCLLCSIVYVIFAKDSSCACAKAFLMSHSSRQSQWSGNCLDKHTKNMHTGGNCFSTGRHSMTHCGLFRWEAHCLATSTLTS